MVDLSKRFVRKDDVKETSNYVFLTVFCTYGTTEINFLKDEIEDRGTQFVFDVTEIEKRALEASFRANKGSIKGVKGVRNLKF